MKIRGRNSHFKISDTTFDIPDNDVTGLERVGSNNAVVVVVVVSVQLGANFVYFTIQHASHIYHKCII